MKRGKAFTLIEVLVGVAILAILGLVIVQIITATLSASRMSNAGIDAAAQARLAFDRLGIDLAAMVRRPDIDFQSTSSFGAAPPYGLLFVSGVMAAGVGGTNNRGYSLVGYQVNVTTDTPTPCLLRGAIPIAWQGTNAVGVTGYETNGLPVSLTSIGVTLSLGDFDVLAPAVIRVVVGYQLYPSGNSVSLSDGTSLQALGQVVYSPPVRLDSEENPSSMTDLSCVSSLIVGVVAIDPDAVKRLKASEVAALAASFPVPSAGQYPVALWSPIAENASGLPAGVPLFARQSVRVFQRAFPINPYGAPRQ
ncbi:MAG: hypothetical protein BGO12_14865 [Verrucomicrobia bacterium 61-8]|nr:prepilin-type N-terminal cleavage/methylation domain-containing protein [Verrucomicrobiota bacterium]OJV02212.1 MAG: hypothetical protein BGO12_14865 [Verrucomicrobia bacterium 61-8]